MKIRLAPSLSALMILALFTGCGGAQLPSATHPAPGARAAAQARLSGRIFSLNPKSQAAAGQMPESLQGLKARIDGAEVAIRMTAYWPPKTEGSQDETLIDYAIDAAPTHSGNQVLEVFDGQGRALGATIIQLEAGRSRVHDISPWSTAMLVLARRQAAREGVTLQTLGPSELLQLGLAPELQNPRAYLDSLAQAVDGDDGDTQSLGGEPERKWL